MALRSIFRVEADIRARDDGYEMEVDIAYNFDPVHPPLSRSFTDRLTT